MPVIATPIPQSPSMSGQPSCSAQSTIIPEITQVESLPQLAKTQGMRIVQGQQATIIYTMRAQDGSAVDLTSCSAALVTLKMHESLQTSCQFGQTLTGTILNPANGQVQVVIPADLVKDPGIWAAEIGMVDPATGMLIFSNFFYLAVERGEFGFSFSSNGPPRISEIRLTLRDNDPTGNLWLGS